MTSDMEDDSDDGSLGDLSMENYTIDLAELARRESGKIGRTGPSEREEEEQGPEGEDGGLQHVIEEGNLRARRGGPGCKEQDSESRNFLDGFEVDLGGLGDKPSSVMVEDRQEEREEVASEADGPEDFTLNMGPWMRGTGKGLKEGNVPSDLVQQRHKAPAPHVHDTTLDFGDGDESVLEPLGTSTPSPKLSNVDHIEVQQKVQAEKRPLLTQDETHLQQDQAAEEVFQRISALQREVEEMREAEERRRSAYDRLNQENELLKKGQARFGSLEEDNFNLRKQNADLQMKVQERKPDFAATASAMGSSSNSESHAADLAAMKAEAERERLATDEKIGTLEAGLKASHSTVRKLREEMAEDEEMRNTKIEGLKEDLEKLRAEINTKKTQIADLEQDMDTHTEIVKHRDQLIARLTKDSQMALRELEHAQQEARESRRIARSVEEENDHLTNHNNRHTEERATMEIALQGKARELQIAQATITTLQAASQRAIPDYENPSATSNEASHQVALDDLKRQHSSALAALNQKFARQLQLFKQDRDMQASKHAAELTKVRETPPPNAAMETELRSAIRALSSKLEKANNATREARAELEKGHIELQHAHQAVETMKKENEFTNVELDTRFAETMDAREREWRRRIAVLFREREMMGKALMTGWGREDVGKEVKGQDGGQGYRYRFFKR